MAETRELRTEIEKRISELVAINDQNREAWLNSGGPDKSRAKEGPFTIGPNFGPEHVLSSYDTLVELRALLKVYIAAVDPRQKQALKDTTKYISKLREILSGSLEEYTSIFERSN